ncbi:hypothetical protein [Bradyrhizobium sp. CCBAU 25360]|uniref:hypothetical protein n=1 Tax=Bradyrhizobium sp. CCBAU 25360 TaxID=858425 RepID=UPI0023061140|nr:hypothetical protein [Bradyrhizobium sp. CCBAU 25360]
MVKRLFAILTYLMVFAMEGLAAEFRVVEPGRVDALHNGSIDVDVVLTSNLKDDNEVVCNFYLEGLILPGDSAKFRNFVQASRWRKFDSPRLCLRSPGGAYDEGLAIARYLMDEAIGTAIESGAVCGSACALIFMAGSAPWKGQLNRFLHVNGVLAFHAPYLDASKMGPKNYSGADVAGSFSQSVQAVNGLIKLGKDRVPHFFDTQLLSEMLDRGPNEVFAIDTVSKAIRYRVALYGAHAPKMSPQVLVNACINYFYDGNLELTPQELSRIKSTTMKRFPQGLRAEFDVAPRGGSCVIDVVMGGGVANRWAFYPNYPGAGGFDGPTGITLAYWYLFPPSTPIASIPRLMQ